jgi:hypothetical protein
LKASDFLPKELDRAKSAIDQEIKLWTSKIQEKFGCAREVAEEKATIVVMRNHAAILQALQEEISNRDVYEIELDTLVIKETINGYNTET